MAKIILPRGSRAGAMLAGAGVAMFGIVVLSGWLAPRPPEWLLPPPGTPSIAAPTAIGFVIAGLCLVACAQTSAAWARVRFASCALLALLALATLAEHASGIALGIDMPGLHRALQGSPTPGRMTPPTALAFLLTTTLLATFDRPAGRGRALLVQLIAGALLALAIVSVIMHDVSPEGLLPWYRYGRMAQATGCAFIAIGGAGLALIAGAPWYSHVYYGREDEKLLVLALGILALALVGTSAAAFAAMQRTLESAMSRTLLQAVSDRAAVLDAQISSRSARGVLAASRPEVAQALAHWDARHDDASRERLSTLARDGLLNGLRAVSFLDDRDAGVVEEGLPALHPTLEIPLAFGNGLASLLWEDGFRLRMRFEVRSGGAFLGTLVAEEDLELFTRLHTLPVGLGRSAEWELCGMRSGALECFPQRLADAPHALLPGGTLDRPMQRALRGERGLMLADDYRDRRVIAAYAPSGDTGLGFEVKIDVHEFYLPLRERLVQWWHWFIGLALVGALLIASQVRPIAQRLVESENVARSRAESLARSERALRELYTSLDDGIMVLRLDGTIEFANPAAERIFGARPGHLAGQPVTAFIPEELREANARSTRRFIESGTSNVIGQGPRVFPALRADGTRFDLEFSVAPMRQGEHQRLVAVLRDVSTRAALERMKGEFVATVSHELRTPLTSLLGSLEILAEGDSLDAEEREFLDMARRNGARLAALVNDVLDTERIESGAMRFADERIALAPFLEEAVQLNQAYAASREVRLRVEGAVPAVEVRGDRARLMQVMANLLSNAAKFSPAGSAVTIRAREVEDGVRVEVTDRGPGIPEEFRSRIFTRFAQADGSDARLKGGTGLGLSICKAIVERLGGRIGFDSPAGGPATFWFVTPGTDPLLPKK